MCRGTAVSTAQALSSHREQMCVNRALCQAVLLLWSLSLPWGAIFIFIFFLPQKSGQETSCGLDWRSAPSQQGLLFKPANNTGDIARFFLLFQGDQGIQRPYGHTPKCVFRAFRGPRREDNSTREVIQITSHSPSTRRRILFKCVAARPTLTQPSPHPGVVARVLSMSTTRGRT